MADVFISHKCGENKVCQELAALLPSYGLSVWWDGMLRGERFDEKILAEINQSSAVVGLLSRRAINADYVIGEIRHAARKTVLARIDDFPLEALPPDLRRWNIIDLSGWCGDPKNKGVGALVTRCQELKNGGGQGTFPSNGDPGSQAERNEAAPSTGNKYDIRGGVNGGTVVIGDNARVTVNGKR